MTTQQCKSLFYRAIKLPNVFGKGFSWSKITIFLLLICFSVYDLSFAQSRDSWNQRIKVAASYSEKIKLSLDAGDFYLNLDKPNLAKVFYESAVTMGNNFLKNSLPLAEALYKLANLQENKKLARKLYQQSLDIYESKLEPNDLHIALVLEALILTVDYEGTEFELAKSSLERAIEIRKKNPDDKGLAETLRVLAWLYESHDDVRNAEKFYLQALNEEIKDLDEGDIRVTLSMEKMAQFYLDTENYKKAEAFLWKKIKLHKRQPYVDLYNLGRSESMLGWTYFKLQYMKDAEKQYLNALSDINKSMDKKNSVPTMASLQALLDLVYFYASQEKYDSAKPYFDLAQSILTNNGDGNLADYAKSLEDELLSGEVSYPWSAHEQIIGIRLMIDYALK